MNLSPEQLEAARARCRALGDRIEAVLRGYENRPTSLRGQDIATDRFRDHVYSGDPIPSDDAVRAAVKEVVDKPSQTDARTKFNAAVAERERLGVPMSIADRIGLCYDLGLRDTPALPRIRDAISEADIAAAMKRYEAHTGEDSRKLLASQKINLTYHYMAVDRAAAPQTPISDMMRREGRTEDQLSAAERMAHAREKAAS